MPSPHRCCLLAAGLFLCGLAGCGAGDGSLPSIDSKSRPFVSSGFLHEVRYRGRVPSGAGGHLDVLSVSSSGCAGAGLGDYIVRPGAVLVGETDMFEYSAEATWGRLALRFWDGARFGMIELDPSSSDESLMLRTSECMQLNLSLPNFSGPGRMCPGVGWGGLLFASLGDEWAAGFSRGRIVYATLDGPSLLFGGLERRTYGIVIGERSSLRDAFDGFAPLGVAYGVLDLRQAVTSVGNSSMVSRIAVLQCDAGVVPGHGAIDRLMLTSEGGNGLTFFSSELRDVFGLEGLSGNVRIAIAGEVEVAVEIAAPGGRYYLKCNVELDGSHLLLSGLLPSMRKCE